MSKNSWLGYQSKLIIFEVMFAARSQIELSWNLYDSSIWGFYQSALATTKCWCSAQSSVTTYLILGRPNFWKRRSNSEPGPPRLEEQGTYCLVLRSQKSFKVSLSESIGFSYYVWVKRHIDNLATYIHHYVIPSTCP